VGDKIISKTKIELCVEDDKYCKLPDVGTPGYITNEKDGKVMGMASGGKFVNWETKESEAAKIPHQIWTRSLLDDEKYFTLTLEKHNEMLHGFHDKKLTIGSPKMPSTHQKIFGNNQYFSPFFFRNF
jgi:hypothetical protein